MKPIQLIDAGTVAGIRYILTDIDDTMTRDGKLSAEAFSALWRLKDAGFRVIPITGRPAGWCDMIIRQWPVDAVIGENGAFAFYLENHSLKQFFHPSVADPAVREKLKELEREVLSKVGGTRVAKDQFSRLYDLAIDFREEPPYLSFEEADRIKEICESRGASAKISSIHVNTWFGEYDKLSMAKLFISEQWNDDVERERGQVFFCGDSPNDEPMFSFFPVTCGVANIRDFLDRMKSVPAYLTTNGHGEGFAEAVEEILKKSESA